MNWFKFFTLFCLSSIVNADNFYCKVVGISDGDTITCLTNKKQQLKIRLYQIDAPEKKQAFGQKSKQLLSNLIFNKNIRLEPHKKDKYRRTLGTIYLNKKDINLEMIRRGMAWYYPFAKKNKLYEQEEKLARGHKRGLWQDKKATAPWEFRKNRKLNK